MGFFGIFLLEIIAHMLGYTSMKVQPKVVNQILSVFLKEKISFSNEKDFTNTIQYDNIKNRNRNYYQFGGDYGKASEL